MIVMRFDGQKAGPRALTMGNVRLDRATNDRTRANNRHFDNQVLQAARLGSRQHLNLGAAFDLEGADRIANADHVVDVGVVELDPAQIDRCLVVVDDQIETFLNQREHAQGQEVDLDHPGVVAGILVPMAEQIDLPSRLAGSAPVR